jgi:hypothetical protein
MWIMIEPLNITQGQGEKRYDFYAVTNWNQNFIIRTNYFKILKEELLEITLIKET